MSIVVVGANHRTAPLELLERMSVRGDSLPKMLHDLCTGEHTSEAVVLATCNRTEVYLVAERFHGAFGEVRNFFSDLTFLPPERFADSLYVHYDDQAVTHLFEVAAGLDSAVPGEHEILGQVRTAWEVARSEQAAQRGLNLLFRHALEVGKRARTETAIGRQSTSVSHAAVRMATERLGSLEGRRAVVVGAGTMGRRLARFLGEAGVGELVVVNRTPQRAEAMLRELQLDAVVSGLGDLHHHLGAADVLFSATEAPEPVVGHVAADAAGADQDRVRLALDGRREPLLAIDLAVPRDIDPSLGESDSVVLLDMTAVAQTTEQAVGERQREALAVRRIVDEEVARYTAASSAREVAPLIASVRQRAETVRSSELDRFAKALAGLDASQREAVEALTKGIVAKLLHEPTVRLKDSAGSSQGDRLATSVAELFDL
ncbi:MAG: glutamyl-tRNA reductase [Microthrixaceae bacterium]|nr:glutamyl-tRNA reductase [Microthrixaceae bacterium]